MSYSTANIPVLENIHTFSLHLESFFNKLKMVKSGWKNYIYQSNIFIVKSRFQSFFPSLR